ncbi:hypothetical protein [Ekhidna sp.]|uniref:hypothetical protein n=1 Tax=Ekhidna sp. TaxID=2608089 RepID=UPI003B5022BF
MNNKIVLFLLLFNGIISHLKSQALDSVSFGKINMSKGIYALNQMAIDEIILQSAQPVPFDKTELKTDGNFAEGVWTLLTGMSTSSMAESAWILNNRLLLSDRQLDIPVMVNGTYHKDRDRVRDSDGYQSVETTESIEFKLEEGAWGWIIEGLDTLGSYEVEIRTIPSDPEGYWNYTDTNIGWLKSKLKKYGLYENSYDFLVRGSFNDESFLLIYSGRYFRQALLQNDEIMGIWQDKPYVNMLSKKYRISPYLLLPQNIEDEQKIIVQLAIGQMLARNLMGI